MVAKREETVGVDLSTNEEITRIVLIWEKNKETAEDFLKECALLYPRDEQRIMPGCIHIYQREKLWSKKKHDEDDIFAVSRVQAKKSKKY